MEGTGQGGEGDDVGPGAVEDHVDVNVLAEMFAEFFNGRRGAGVESVGHGRPAVGFPDRIQDARMYAGVVVAAE